MIKINKEYSIKEEEFLIESSKNYSIEKLSEAFEILNVGKIKTIDETFLKILNALNLKSDVSMFLSNKNKKHYLDYLKSCIEKDNLFTDYFTKIKPVKDEFLKSCIPLLYEGKTTKKSVYSHATKTGRVSIVDGFNYLTLKKEKRKLLSYKKDYKLYEIDFSSCEPNFYIAAYLKKDLKEKRIYDFFSEKFNIKSSNFKRGFLALLYGANNKTISNLSGLSIEKINKIKDYLKIKNFESQLDTEFEKNNFILNFYNRPILNNSNIVNYWIQSSVADYCCLAFSQFLKENDYLNLHAFIHDSIIVSCHKKDDEKIRKIQKITENISNVSIHVRINEII